MSATTVLDVAAVDAAELPVACEDAATYEHAVFVVGVRAGVAGIIVGFGDVVGASLPPSLPAGSRLSPSTLLSARPPYKSPSTSRGKCPCPSTSSNQGHF